MPELSRTTFLSALGGGLAGLTLPGPASAQANTVRIGAPFSDTFGAPFYAKDAGAFAKAGFNIEVTALSNAGAVAAAIAGGALELGLGDFVSSTNAISKGVPLQLMAGCGLYRSSEPVSVVCVPKDSPIRGPRDLVGKSCSAPTLVGVTTASLKAWLAKNGVDPQQVKVVELTSSSAPAAVLRGTVDAGLLAEPYYTPVRDQFRDIGHNFDALASEFLISAWFANASWFAADPERAKRVIAAIYETQRWANTHRDQTLALFANTMKMDPEKLTGMRRTTYATQLLPRYVQPVLDAAAKYNLIEHHIDAVSMFPKL
jgi:NitT/TauT family transport system substrate-binding protein